MVEFRGCIILAGGRGVRIGGCKPFIPLAGRPLISYILDSVRSVVNEIVIVIDRSADMSKFKNLIMDEGSVVYDIFDLQSPIVGIISGAEALSSQYAAVVPCDSPFLKSSVLNMLFERASGVDAAIPMWSDGRIEPLHAVYRVKSCLKAGLEAIRMGELSNWDMIRRLNSVKMVSVEEIQALDRDLISFFNINTVEDLKVAEDILRSASR